MMLIVLDKNPIIAAQLVPDRIKFKQLLELCQMICSCGYSDIYKLVKQGKNIQEWIKKNNTWVKSYAKTLLDWCKENINLKFKTYNDLKNIISSMPVSLWVLPIRTSIFRYVKEYDDTSYPSDSELPIDIAVAEYKKYVEWKGWGEINAHIQS